MVKGSLQDTQQAGGAIGWNAAIEILRVRLDRFAALEAKVLKGDDPEAIHDIRVASRRLQQGFDLLYPQPRGKRAGRLRQVIRKSRRVLSDSRNYDVLLQETDEALKKTRANYRESWQAFREYLSEERLKCLTKDVNQLTSLNLSSFYLAMQNFLKEHSTALDVSRAEAQADASTNQELPPRFEDRLAGTILRSWETLEENVEKASNVKTAENLHAVRIAAKKVRYVLEVADEMEIPGTDSILTDLKKLQRLLGDWHDMQVLEETMIDMLARPKFLRAHLALAIETGKLILRNRSRKQRVESQYFNWVAESQELGSLRDKIGSLVSQPPLAA